MNAKQVKKIRKWCTASYKETDPSQRGNMTLEQYIEKAKSFWKITPDFRTFVDTSLREHFGK